MRNNIILFIFCLLLPLNLLAQHDSRFLMGRVVTENEKGEEIPLIGANIYWFNTQIVDTSDKNGFYKLKKIDGNYKVVVSFIGYKTDTFNVKGKDRLHVWLKSSTDLDDVDIIYRKKSTETDFVNPISVQNIGEKEIHKAACCNLSESFETSPSVDVSFTDAVTGTRQIMMLGLAGKYTQITRENMPNIRGLSSIYGLSYTPGVWVDQIQLIKGTGSVLNGFESIAGQINVDLWRPQKMDKLYINLYANKHGRVEANANVKFGVSKKLQSALLVHASNNSIKNDKNKDGFIDKPLSNQFVVLNRWELLNNLGMHIEAGVKATYIDKIGGQSDFNLGADEGTTNYWGMHLLTKRIEAWTKTGKVFKNKPYKSIALQTSGAIHNQHSYFGLKNYEAEQNSLYANFIYTGIFGNTNHKFKTGLSFQYDDYKEEYNTANYYRKESVLGAYFEYTYNYNEKFNLVAGLRADYHNILGAFATPRLHLRYAMFEKTVFRVSAGRGQRTANIFSENSALMSSSREFVIQGDNSDKPYGLNPEVAWNYGINLTQYFTLDYREGTISFDFHRTDFENQIIVDLEQSPQQAVFYNLEGQSYSNSFQTQLDYEVLKRFDVRIAYRWYDVKTTYNGVLMKKPLVSEQRAFINFAYATRNKWKFDYTINWQGNKRIPSTQLNPEEFRLDDKSPDFYTMNAQITKSWKKKFDVYLGVENILDFTQENPIIASNQAFSQYFDSTLIWGPIFGRSFYIGIRYRIK